MSKGEFLYLLLGASYASYKFAKSLVIEELPSDFKYKVILNFSCDDQSLTEFDFYPEDDGKILDGLSDTEVMNLLNRKEKVPVWIDVSVTESNNHITTVELLCAGRYSNNPEEYYYRKQGSGPFGIKSPKLPSDFIDGVKFKLNKN
jgi:hypothetical protein